MIKEVGKFLIPNWLYQRVFKYFLSVMKKKRIQKEERIPKVSLEQKHIENCELLLNRTVLLSKLKKNAVVAEIGVASGEFSKKIMDVTKPKKLHLIDIWGNQRYNEEKYQVVRQKFSPYIKNNRVVINRKLSTEAADDFPDNYFDWIYIDTNHSYQTTKQELIKFAPKVKKNGIISGHDYLVGHWISSFRYGVIEATHEFCVENDWELVYLTVDPLETQSFAIKKINK